MNIDLEQQFSIEKFEAGQIDPEHFGHAAHVYVAWLYVNRYGADAALPRFDSALRRLTERLGVPDKYHATITGFLLTLIAQRVGDNDTWSEFRTNNADLILDCRSVLSIYYSDSCLNSSAARRQFLQPDCRTA